MKKIIRNPFCNDTIFVRIQMNKTEYAALKKFMAVLEPAHYRGTDIFFPQGVRLVKQGYGWYNLIPPSEHKAVAKIQCAMTQAFGQFEEEQTALVEEQIKMLIPAVVNNLQMVAYSTHGAGEYHYLAVPDTTKAMTFGTPSKALPVKEETKVHVSQLEKLASKFAHSLRVGR